MRYGFVWFGVTCLALGFWVVQPAGATEARVVINELYYHSEPACAPLEYVELMNAGDEPVHIGGWFLADGIRFTFPEDAVLEPGELCVVAEDPWALRGEFPDIPARVYGPYQGRLSNSGERIELLDRQRRLVDAVAYSDRAPWPALADGLGASLELIHPSLREFGAAAWRASHGATLRNSDPVTRFDVSRVTATPGRANSVYQEAPPPLVGWPQATPASPSSGEEVLVEAQVYFADPEAVMLLYQVVEPGDYIPLNSPDYADQWTTIAMQPLGNDRYAAAIPGQKHRSLVRYIIQARNDDGETRLPDPTEPTPNLAYFVYDGVPPYRARIPEERVHTELEKVPVYHLIAHPEDVYECQYSPLTGRVERREFRWYGTFVHNGRVYDHVRFRLRGGVWRYTFNKRMWKIRFNKGDYFEGVHNDGTPYATPRRTINLNAITQNMRVHNPKRGELGLFETAGFWLFRMAGVSSPHTDWVHFRIIQRENEDGRDQYTGDFMGLYLSIEQMDERFLEAHGIPDESALYKMNRGWTVDGKVWEKETDRCDPLGDADITAFYNGYNRNGLPFVERTLDIDKYLSYRVIIEAIHHYDVYAEKNYYYMRNSRSGLWEVLPWDLDITFGADHGNGREPFRDMVVGHLSRRGTPTEAPYTPHYRNRMREIMQLLYNEEVFFPVLDEWYDLIKEIAAADLDRWDLFTPRDAEPAKSRYQPLDYRLREMKDWIIQRIHTSYTDNANDGVNFILSLQEMVHDPAIPETPAIVSHADGVRLPPETVEFVSSNYADPNNSMHMASRWIVTREGEFEIQPDWDSGPSQTERRTLRLDLSAFEPGEYRLRVRHLNLAGRWSWYSEPLRFTIEENVGVEHWSLY